MTTEPTVAHMPLTEPESEWVLDGLRSEIRQAEENQRRRQADGLSTEPTARYIDAATRLLGHLQAAHRAAFAPREEDVVDAEVLPSASEVATAFEEAYEELRSLLPEGVRVSSDKLAHARTLIGHHIVAEVHADIEAHRARRPEDQPAAPAPPAIDPEVAAQLEVLAELIRDAHQAKHANRGAFLAGYEQGQLVAQAEAERRERHRESTARLAFARSEFVPPAEPTEPTPAPTFDRETRARITGRDPSITGYGDLTDEVVRNAAAGLVKEALTELRRRRLPWVHQQCGAYDTTGEHSALARRCQLEAGHDDPAEGVETDAHLYGRLA